MRGGEQVHKKQPIVRSSTQDHLGVQDEGTQQVCLGAVVCGATIEPNAC